MRVRKTQTSSVQFGHLPVLKGGGLVRTNRQGSALFRTPSTEHFTVPSLYCSIYHGSHTPKIDAGSSH